MVKNLFWAGLLALPLIAIGYRWAGLPWPLLVPPEERMQAFVTGYSYWDNTPPQSRVIARPVVHRQAGGTGTWRDPVTLAVGHRIEDGEHFMDYPVGTRFYFPRLRRYAVVEDMCGDGPRPQDGPCHIGYRGLPWLDIYVGGESIGSDASGACMRSITGVQEVIIHPRDDYPVSAGEIAATLCTGAGEI